MLARFHHPEWKRQHPTLLHEANFGKTPKYTRARKQNPTIQAGDDVRKCEKSHITEALQR
jgi:hypothetical protein